jgi:hypothetical protein
MIMTTPVPMPFAARHGAPLAPQSIREQTRRIEQRDVDDGRQGVDEADRRHVEPGGLAEQRDQELP